MLDATKPNELIILTQHIRSESEELIEILNFFELVAYLKKNRNIDAGDMNALLGYYLRQLANQPELRRYVTDKEKSFEHLSALLAKIKVAG